MEAFFDQLEALIRVQDESCLSAAEVLANIRAPSISIAILENGKIYSRTFSTVGDDTDTVFQACSISKPNAGMCAMRLVQAGLLDLDTPIPEYLSATSFDLLSTPLTRKLLANVTLRQLMSHTSGLSQHGFPGYSNRSLDINIRDVLLGQNPVNTRHVHLEGLPGRQFCYSGGGISVTQLIMEEVTGKSFPDLMSEYVLTPLGMDRSFYKTPTKDDNYASAHWTGYTKCDPDFHIQPEQAAAGLWTTPTDLLKVVRAVQHSLTAQDGSGFLSPDLMRLMLTEVSETMALTWFAPKDPGNVFHHGGDNIPGYECFLFGYADLKRDGSFDPNLEGRGISIMTNAFGGCAAYQKLIHAITYMKNWADLPTFMAFPEVVIPLRTLDPSVDPAWIAWKGTWTDEKGRPWQFSEHEGQPSVRFNDLPPVRLLPAARLGTGEAIDLVLEGLEMMARLTKGKTAEDEEENEKQIKIWYGPRSTPTAKSVLKRNMS